MCIIPAYQGAFSWYTNMYISVRDLWRGWSFIKILFKFRMSRRPALVLVITRPYQSSKLLFLSRISFLPACVFLFFFFFYFLSFFRLQYLREERSLSLAKFFISSLKDAAAFDNDFRRFAGVNLNESRNKESFYSFVMLFPPPPC